ncbi:hypothetical protein STVIR_1428 [Streptomyces viridochromogenes Tue57]|uniref:Uncharacterized protein n=1 Tax=Streptomyces viridochromogenes Tue57 TaxID=1160705 RepID=L8PQ70_STRVR|nr:hypothetical protein STVIR_1428 [Streptomyces viridochromogenes Tue57]
MLPPPPSPCPVRGPRVPRRRRPYPPARAHPSDKQEHGPVEDGNHGRCVRTHGCSASRTGRAHVRRTARALRRGLRRRGGAVRAGCRARLDPGRGGAPRPPGGPGRGLFGGPSAGDAR